MGHTHVLVLAGLLGMASAGCSGCRSSEADESAQSRTQSQEEPNDAATVEQAGHGATAAEQPPASAERTAPHPGSSVHSAARENSGEAGAPSGRKAEPGDAATLSPEDALNRARELYSSAQGKRQRRDHQGAFDDARRAWSMVRQFPDDPACRGLADTLYAELDGYTDRAAAEGGPPPTNDTPLILQ